MSEEDDNNAVKAHPPTEENLCNTAAEGTSNTDATTEDEWMEFAISDGRQSRLLLPPPLLYPLKSSSPL
ncbi:hypothetical protein DY000_02020121 [Brassica cretica]|uniref:Uncharacterized protein n=1 Tax=Brassica cretica TaxID=69181 RepID=A0ABQ7E1H2_BRACR|nr:hypothetical protein DY000_02020121 [Brassica cretica]